MQSEIDEQIALPRLQRARHWLHQNGLPLLAKELIEQSARRRTYVVRTLYATLLFIAAFLIFYEALSNRSVGGLSVLGKGRRLFEALVLLQFTGIHLFMPAMTSGLITQEKERSSLQLLMLTKLGPWTILFEKLASRVIPMLMFVFLSLPMLAFAYTLGGVTLEWMLIALGLLVLAVLQMGSLALLCSTFFRTTTGAFIWSYLLIIAFFTGPSLMWVIAQSLFGFDVSQLYNRGIGFDVSWSVLCEVPFVTAPLFEVGLNYPTGSRAPLLIHVLLVLAQCTTCLLLARYFFVRRSNLPPKNLVLAIFKKLDGLFLRWNDNPLTKGIVFGKGSAALPAVDPVAWRETQKRSLGTSRYLARVFIALEIPIIVLCLLVIFSTQDAEPLGLLLFLTWVVAALLISSQSASLIAGERSHQTLDVLACTPLTGREIIQQKYRGVWRLMLVLGIPFLTIFGFTAAMCWGISLPESNMFTHRYEKGFRLDVYLVGSLLSIGIYLPLIAWMSLYVGLRVKTQARAIIGSLAAILAWCLLPLLFVLLPIQIMFNPAWRDGAEWMILTTPWGIMVTTQAHDWRGFSSWPWVVLAVNYVWYGGWLSFFRQSCLSSADRYLGRADSKNEILSAIAPKLNSREPIRA